jgi:hypothetical protein
MRSVWRRLIDALHAAWEWTDPDRGLTRLPDGGFVEVDEPTLELPWRFRWDHLPKRSAGFGFTQRDYRDARRRAEEVARATLGDALWFRLRRDGYLSAVDAPPGGDVPPARRSADRGPLRTRRPGAVAAPVPVH